MAYPPRLTPPAPRQPMLSPSLPILPLFVIPLGLRGRQYLQDQAVLLASVRDVTAVTTGSNTGIGNQGSSNTAHMVGHSGTGLGQGQVPRSIAFGRQQ